jgi:hypothetical protein
MILTIDIPTIQDLDQAHEDFLNLEPRGLFYRAATELVDLVINGKSKLSMAEAIAVLLQTWNISYYRFRPFDEEHFSNIERLLENYQQIALDIRQRTIESFCDEDANMVKAVFEDFENVLGKTGAAKCLHLLAPRFFPLWDTKIAVAYKLAKGNEAECYCSFMEITREQCKGLGGEKAIGRNPLKALDEYNYCKITLPELERRRNIRRKMKNQEMKP